METLRTLIQLLQRRDAVGRLPNRTRKSLYFNLRDLYIYLIEKLYGRDSPVAKYEQQSFDAALGDKSEWDRGTLRMYVRDMNRLLKILDLPKRGEGYLTEM